MHTGVASSLLLYRTKCCEKLHAGLPLGEAKMDVHRGKAARQGSSWLLRHWEYSILPEACSAVNRVAARRVCSVRGCYQVVIRTGVDPQAQNVAEKQGGGQDDVAKSATASFPRSQAGRRRSNFCNIVVKGGISPKEEYFQYCGS